MVGAALREICSFLVFLSMGISSRRSVENWREMREGTAAVEQFIAYVDDRKRKTTKSGLVFSTGGAGGR